MFRYIKKRIIKYLRKSDIGNNIIIKWQNKQRFKRILDEYIDELKNTEKYAIFGTDGLALKIAKIFINRTRTSRSLYFI